MLGRQWMNGAVGSQQLRLVGNLRIFEFYLKQRWPMRCLLECPAVEHRPSVESTRAGRFIALTSPLITPKIMKRKMAIQSGDLEWTSRSDLLVIVWLWNVGQVFGAGHWYYSVSLQDESSLSMIWSVFLSLIEQTTPFLRPLVAQLQAKSFGLLLPYSR